MQRGHILKKLMIIGLVLSILGFVTYFLSPHVLDEYAEISQSGGLIVFASGWALLLGSLVFTFGMEARKNPARD